MRNLMVLGAGFGDCVTAFEETVTLVAVAVDAHLV